MQEETDNGEIGYTLLHVTQDGSPLTDQRVRCALANATDEQAIIDKIKAGVLADRQRSLLPGAGRLPGGHRLPAEAGHGEGQELIADYKAENPGPLNICLATTQDETNLIIAQSQQQW